MKKLAISATMISAKAAPKVYVIQFGMAGLKRGLRFEFVMQTDTANAPQEPQGIAN
jgi:hypothetical protein